MRWVLGAIVMLLLLFGYAAWSVISTRTALLDAQASALRFQRAVAQQDAKSSHTELLALQRSFRSAHARSDGPLWAVGSRLPWVGDDVSAVRTVASVGDDLAQGTLAEIVDETDNRLADRLVPARRPDRHQGDRVALARGRTGTPQSQRGSGQTPNNSVVVTHSMGQAGLHRLPHEGGHGGWRPGRGGPGCPGAAHDAGQARSADLSAPHRQQRRGARHRGFARRHHGPARGPREVVRW